jgi:hypothetical protein
MIERFSTERVAKIIGRTTRFVQDWSERGIISPDVQDAAGSGTRRVFSRDGVYRVALAFHLKETFLMPRGWIKFLMSACKDARIEWDRNTLWVGVTIEDQPFASIIGFPKDFAMENRMGSNADFVTYIDLSKIREWTDNRIKEIE